MAHRILDRVQETTTSVGTGALNLAGAVNKMLSFSGAGFQNGDTFRGLIEHATANEWEIAICTYSAGTITRTSFIKSSTGSTVAFSAGTKTISLVDTAVGRDAVASPAISGGALSLDLALANAFTVTLNGNAAVSFANAFAANLTNAFMLQLTADGTPRTLTWPGSVAWPFGAPTLTSTNGKRDLVSFLSLNGGASWIGFIVGQNF